MTTDAVQLADVIALTDQVQAAITTGAWREATDLERARRELLAVYLEQHRSSGLDELAGELAELQNTNNHMIGEVFHHRRRLEREATTVSTGRRAIRAYAEQEAIPPQP